MTISYIAFIMRVNAYEMYRYNWVSNALKERQWVQSIHIGAESRVQSGQHRPRLAASLFRCRAIVEWIEAAAGASSQPACAARNDRRAAQGHRHLALRRASRSSSARSGTEPEMRQAQRYSPADLARLGSERRSCEASLPFHAHHVEASGTRSAAGAVAGFPAADVGADASGRSARPSAGRILRPRWNCPRAWTTRSGFPP